MLFGLLTSLLTFLGGFVSDRRLKSDVVAVNWSR